MSIQPVTMSSTPAGLPWSVTTHMRTARCGVSRGIRTLIGRCVLNLATPTWMALDLLIVTAGTLIGQRLFVWWHPQVSGLIDYKMWVVSSALGISVVLAGLMFGLYEQNTLWHRGRIVSRALLTITFAIVATFIVVQVFLYSEMSRRTAAFSIVFYLLIATGLRLIAHKTVRHVQRGLLVIGHGPSTSLLLRAIQHGRLPGYRLYGIVSDEPRRYGHSIRGVPIIGGMEHLAHVIAERDIHEVVVADSARRDLSNHSAALQCLRQGCRVTNETTFYETAFGEVPVAHVDAGWFFHADLSGQREEHATMKRVFDICVSLIGLSLTLPLLPFVALVIWIFDRGPVFYSQMRVGQGGRVFKLHKLRTMRTDAESGGTVWAQQNDPRVTIIGRWLRQSRLDELPQLWNVLRGDMSMVGPRPERPEIVDQLSPLIPFFQERHLIKPGITGWAQIRYRYGASVADSRRKLQFDLYYIKHMSLELDLIILLRTVGTFLLGAR